MRVITLKLVSEIDLDIAKSTVGHAYLLHLYGSGRPSRTPERIIVRIAALGLLTILTPLAPAGFNGPLSIVDAGRVKAINSSVGEVSATISHWGVGLQ